jgi:Holliday junction DNA helicase RuvA
MISYIQGILHFSSGDGTLSIITQSGVGYCVNAGQRYASTLNTGQEISLFVETIVKETGINLYGFQRYEEQAWFRSLLKVTGVGPKVAINVIDSISIQELTQAIINEKSEMLQKVGGLGEKVSQRIVAELKKEPAKNAKALALIKIGSPKVTFINSMQTENTPLQSGHTENLAAGVNHNDIISALVNLGFDYNRSFSIAADVSKIAVSLEEAITLALQKIGS